MKLATVLTAVLGITAICPATAQDTKTVKLRILETSDVHGCFFPYNFIERNEAKGSLARVSSYVNRLRKEYGENVILLDNGDILQGQPTCYYYNYVATDKRNIVADILNYMNYDAATLGNHDVETGHAVYDKWISETSAPVLGANVINTATGKPYTRPYTVIERDGVKIAVVGMLTPAIPSWLGERLWKGMRFESIEKTAREYIERIRKTEHPDIVIGLFHSGWNGGIDNSEYTEDETESTAKNVDGFDIIFFGHDHHARKAVVRNAAGNEVLCLDPSCNAVNIADAEVEITLRDGKVEAKKITGEIRDITGEPIDTAYMKRFAGSIGEINGFVNSRIGELADTIYTRDCFFGNSAFTDLIHNLQLAITNADVSFNAPLQFDTRLNKGDILMSDMFKLYKYENNLCVMRMTGEEIKNYLEMSYSLWTNTMRSADDHIMLIDERNNGDMQKFGFRNFTFNFDSAAGIDYEVDVTKPQGKKVKILRMSDGEKFSPTKWYRVVMNSYRANGGGELLTMGAGIAKDKLRERMEYERELDMRHYLAQKIKSEGKISAKPNSNWRFVPEKWTKAALERDRKLIFGKPKE